MGAAHWRCGDAAYLGSHFRSCHVHVCLQVFGKIENGKGREQCSRPFLLRHNRQHFRVFFGRVLARAVIFALGLRNVHRAKLRHSKNQATIL